MTRASGAALFLVVSNLVILRFLVLLGRRDTVPGPIAGAPDRPLLDPLGQGTSGNLHSHCRTLTNVIGARGHRPVKGYSGVPLPGNPSRTRCPRTPVRAEFKYPSRIPGAARGQLDTAGTAAKTPSDKRDRQQPEEAGWWRRVRVRPDWDTTCFARTCAVVNAF